MSADHEMHTAPNGVLRQSEPIMQEGEATQDSHRSTVTLLVGPAQEKFTVAQELLCRRVAFFRNAFQGSFVEAKTKTFTFPDDEPENFENLVAWVEEGPMFKAHFAPTWLWLCRLWVFAEKYHIDDLQNDIVDALHAKFAEHRSGINISYDTLDYVAENTFSRSPLWRMFVDMLTNGISLQQLPSRVANIPLEMLQDMVISLKETAYRNNPTATSLLNRPVESYYISSDHCKTNAMPTRRSSSDLATPFACDGDRCVREGRPIWDAMYICTHHQLKFCEECGPDHRGHRLKLISFTTPAYRDNITGSGVTVIDGHINDSGFYCDGPACDPGEDQLTHTKNALMSGDRYHCLDCWNKDYCTLCVRGLLQCKDDGHSMLRIRPTFAKRNPLRDVSLHARQERIREGVCWRCASSEHNADSCEEAVKSSVDDVEVEE